MGVVLDDSTVFIVMTEINGYKNIYGHVLFSSLADANDAKREIEEKDCFDTVWISEWKVV